MSLTRTEWLVMWAAIKKIEMLRAEDCHCSQCKAEWSESISMIKSRIQSVIGQLQ